jgi:nucleotide-binding universal stress UspA family protein
MQDTVKPPIDRILCPVDFSDFSRHALDQALAIAKWCGASVTVLHVVPPELEPDPLLPMGRAAPAPLTATHFNQLRAQVTRFARAEGGDQVPVTVEVTEGNIVAETLRFATEPPADLLVLGTHGRSGFDRLLLGSVTERLLRKAPCPVLTVPRRMPDVVPVGPVLYRRILCAVDFSPSSAKALDYAIALEAASDARVSALHVVEAGRVLEPDFVDETGGYQSVLRGNAVERLHRFAAAHGGAARTAHQVVGSGKPYAEILRVAGDERSDLIVLGVHGGVAGLTGFGSTVNQVVRHASCPVLSLRA